MFARKRGRETETALLLLKGGRREGEQESKQKQKKKRLNTEKARNSVAGEAEDRFAQGRTGRTFTPATTPPSRTSQEPELTKKEGAGGQEASYDSTSLAIVDVLHGCEVQRNVPGQIRADGLRSPHSHLQTHSQHHSRPKSPSTGNDASPASTLTQDPLDLS